MAQAWAARSIPSAAGTLVEAGYPRRVAELLALRGVEDAGAAARFLSPAIADLGDERALLGLDAAVEALVAARSAGRTVAVVGDYDVDGISATAILIGGLRALGFTAEPILPSRSRGGYGLQPAHVERARQLGAGLLITADCGMQAHEAIEAAGAARIPVIVTDHHLPGPRRPEAVAILNPQQPGCGYPFRDLCGAGLALKLVAGLFRALDREPPMEALLRMACLGTIADAVPLRGENRTIARLGLELLPKSPSPGLRALFALARLEGRLSASDVAFRIGPRLNAPGRIGDPDPALELLLTRDRDRARSVAGELEEANRRRQELEQRVLADCDRLFAADSAPPIVVAWSESWHRGVVGIAAGRLARSLHRPVVLFACADGHATGSGRSVPGLDLHALLQPAAGLLERFGGHAQAVGMSAASARLEEVRRAWIGLAEAIPADARERPPLEYDLDLRAGELSNELAAELERFEPFGNGNPEPLFRLGPLRAAGEPRRFGRGHLELQARDEHGDALSILAWGWADRDGPWSREFEVVGAIERDSWGGATRLKLRLVDARVATASAD